MSNTTALPDLTQINSPSGRTYQDSDGNSFVSVTTALGIIDKSQGLTKWAAKLERDLVVDAAVDAYTRCHVTNTFPAPNQFRQMINSTLPGYAYNTAKEAAGSLGTEVHEAIEQFFKTGSIPQCSPAANLALNEFQTWWSTQNLTALLVEERLVSRKYGFAGTADLLVLSTTDDKVTLVDFKTSNYISWSYFLQLAAYREALAELGHPRATSGMIVQLPKTPTHKLRLHPVEDLDKHFEAFLSALDLYNARADGDPWIKGRKEYGR